MDSRTRPVLPPFRLSKRLPAGGRLGLWAFRLGAFQGDRPSVSSSAYQETPSPELGRCSCGGDRLFVAYGPNLIPSSSRWARVLRVELIRFALELGSEAARVVAARKCLSVRSRERSLGAVNSLWITAARRVATSFS